ncbi:MAG: host attachment protein [Pseudomonadota bacterium]
MPKKVRTWILIADGRRARILLNEGPGRGLKPAIDADFINPAVHGFTRDLGSDRPGRGHSGKSGTPHALEPRVDWHRHEKHVFARRMAAYIDQAATKGEFDRLVLVAPPQALGDLRQALGAHAAERVTGELARDLTKHSDADVAKHLAGVVRV